MKKLILIAAALMVTVSAFAQGSEENATPKYSYKQTGFASVPKVGGYIIGGYKYSDLATANGGPGFNCRLIRLYVDGSIFNDFKYRIQFQANGTSPHVKDFFIEWAHWKEFSIKMGQFKRAFTFENPMNPWDVGVGDFSLLVQKGEKKYRLLHYQLGVYNGQGINVTDVNRAKDIIGTIQFQPIPGLFIGAFGWTGYWRNAEGTDLKRERISAGLKYDYDNWTVRAEYATAIGGEVAESGAADAFYVTVGVPVLPWLKVYAKWDEFRAAGTPESTHDLISACLNFRLHKNLNFQVEYRYHNNKLLTNPQYNELWLMGYIRF